MRAAVLHAPGQALQIEEVDDPLPGVGQILVEVAACAVCRTDLHVIDGDLPASRLPIIPGHEIVGRVARLGDGVSGFAPGDRLGIPWLGETCGCCRYCRSGHENLCDQPGFTGYTLNGGFAELVVANAQFCFPIDERFGDVEAAPLLCAGLIGYRCLNMAGSDVRSLGIYGFGAAAHIIAQVADHLEIDVFAFTRPGDKPAQAFARELGAVWTGGSDEMPPAELDAAIIFAPVGPLVPIALRAVRKGGVVVCGGIHMSDIPAFPYSLLWGERCVRSVANLTRKDAEGFLALAPRIPVRTTTQTFRLDDVNTAIDRLRRGELTGAAVIVPCCSEDC